MRLAVRGFAAWWMIEFAHGAIAEWRAISAARKCKIDVADLWELDAPDEHDVPDTRPVGVVSLVSAQLESANR